MSLALQAKVAELEARVAELERIINALIAQKQQKPKSPNG